MGFNTQSQESGGSSSGSNRSFGSAMNLGQETQYQNLWAQAGAMNQNAGNAAANNGMRQFNTYQGAAGNALGGAGMQQANATLGRLQNPGMDPQMQMYANQVGRQFNEQIMPGLRGDAMVAGGLGGSRAGIAQGLAGARAGQQIQDFGAQLYGQNQDRAMNAANMQGTLALNQAQGYQGLGTGELAGAQFGMGVPWYNLQQYAGLLGGPVMEDIGGYGSTNSDQYGQGSGVGMHIW